MTQRRSISFEPKNVEELHHFLAAYKNSYPEIWIILTKKAIANPQPVSFNEAVAEAVSQGLVDSRTKSVSEQKYAIRFTKRKKLSAFESKINGLGRTKFLSQRLH
jgi:hypothetical protein